MDQTETFWHSLAIEKVFNQLKSKQTGLLDDEAKLRRLKSGFNELPKKKKLTKLQLLLAQFKSALVYILIIAAAISFFLGEHVDVYVIAAAIFINVVVGFIQENKAQRALEKLSKMVVPEVKVIRDGQELKIRAKDLVLGDIIHLEAGDRIAADARLFEAIEMETSEAALTGESSPVDKQVKVLDRGVVLAERINMIYSGTLVTKGRGKAVVVNTGIKTEIGRIAGLLKEIEEELTPLQKKLNIFSKHLGFFILFLSIAILVLGITTGRDFVMMFNTAVAVAVAAIPEGLLVAVTVILALGMQSILKKKALVRKLVAAETLGSTTVICTDKTGTLTLGEMRVVEVITDSSNINIIESAKKIIPSTLAEGFLLLQIGMLCNDAVVPESNLKESQVLGSGTEKALMMAGMQIGVRPNDLNKQYNRLDEIPFSSERKYMATLHHKPDRGNIIYFKGAPEKIIKAAEFIKQGDRKVKIYKDKREEIISKYEKLSQRGLRVLAFGYKPAPEDLKKLEENDELFKGLVIVGFAAIADPLRKTVKQTLEETNKAGIKTVMITGDNKITAKTIAKELGLNCQSENVLEGEDLSKLDDIQLAEKVNQISIYARVTPKDKLRIVHAWQNRGEVVAMTGDGVNDAPALKRADVGIAFGSGSDVAKETADLVLLNNSFNTIVAAVKQGRVIYENIKKVILYLLSDSFSEVILIFGSLAFGLPLPLLPAQILWINLVTDGFPHIALTLEKGEKEIMSEPPQERKKPILDFERRLLIGVISFFTAVSTLGIFYYFWKVVGDLELARTVTFVALGVDSLLYVFSCRTLRHSIFNSHFFANRYLLLAVILGGVLQVSAVYVPFFQKLLRTVPLGAFEWLFIGGVSIMVIMLIEIIKWIFIARHKV